MWEFDSRTEAPTKLNLPLLKRRKGEELQILGLKQDEIRPILVQLLQREDELRLSSAAQLIYREIGDDEGKLSSFTGHLQAQVCGEFGIDPQIGVQLIRRCADQATAQQPQPCGIVAKAHSRNTRVWCCAAPCRYSQTTTRSNKYRTTSGTTAVTRAGFAMATSRPTARSRSSTVPGAHY